MTAKQKANRERFKKVVAEAKKLRKKNPKLTQAQAVKQAWAIMYSKKRAGVGAVKKKAVKKKAKPTKVKAKKGKTSGEMHTDTKSHNVSIRVMSGIGKKAQYINNPLMKYLQANTEHAKELQHLTNALAVARYSVKRAQEEVKKTKDKSTKNYFRLLAQRQRDTVQGLKQQIAIVKRLIK